MSFTQPPAKEILCVVGTRGEGKTSFRTKYLANIRRVVAWNPMEDGIIGTELTVHEFSARRNEFRFGVLRLTIYPSSYDEDTMEDEFDECCAIVADIGGLHFAVEEPGLIFSPNRVPGNFRMLCIKGRHHGVSMSLYGQRFVQMPPIARGQATEIIMFRQSDPLDIKDFDNRIRPYRCPVPLHALPPYHFIRFTRETGPVYHSPVNLASMREDHGNII